SATSFGWKISRTVLPISAIMGISKPCTGELIDWASRYQQAHRALAQAQLEGCSYYINGDDLRRRLAEEQLIHNGLLKFFENEPGALRLHLVYQPIVRSSDRHKLNGAEVLLRCQHQELGFIPPNRIVALCERFGLGVELGRWLFRQIAAETRQLYENFDFFGTLSINLNPAMLTEALIEDVQQLLINAGIPAPAICMEITEDNAALDFASINPLINQLHSKGVTFALDDFGTGHSSLEYVRELKIDRLKIDRCFVDGIEHSQDKARFLGSIIAMAEQAYMESVVEGVENEAQWQLIAQEGEVLIQGYHAHKPMPFNAYLALILDPATRYPANPTARLAHQKVECDH
ncbi:MAG: EAL domain-containing protein, partial [Marinobacter sp.]